MTFNEALGYDSRYVDRKTGATLSHNEVYDRVIEYLGGLDAVIPYIPFDKEEITAARKAESDRDIGTLNALPLRKWDAAVGITLPPGHTGLKLTNSGLMSLILSKGITSISMSEGVCILKRAAYRWSVREDSLEPLSPDSVKIRALGFSVDKLSTDQDSLKAFVSSRPHLKAQILAWEKLHISAGESELDGYAEKAFSTDSAKDICDLAEEHGPNPDASGFANIVEIALTDAAGMRFMSCRDKHTDECFVVLPRYYPWNATEEYKGLKSANHIKNIVEKALGPLTDQPLADLDWGTQNISCLDLRYYSEG